jgi:hypothetical protein
MASLAEVRPVGGEYRRPFYLDRGCLRAVRRVRLFRVVAFSDEIGASLVFLSDPIKPICVQLVTSLHSFRRKHVLYGWIEVIRVSRIERLPCEFITAPSTPQFKLRLNLPKSGI